LQAPVDVIRSASLLIENEKAEAAIKELADFLLDRDNPHVWMKLAHAYQIVGEELVARAIFRNVILRIGDPHIVDVIAARIPYCKPVVVKDLKTIYFNIPKCGSSSLKDAFILATGGDRKGETSHFHISHLTEVVPFQKIDNDYSDFKSIAIVREPQARLRSYWNKNIRDGSLRNEAGGRETYYGLSTSPDYERFLRDFRRYRSVFRDFRHHTDSIVGYLGRSPNRIKNIFDISETAKAMAMIENFSGVKLPEIRNMRSGIPFSDLTPKARELEQEILSAFYADEIDLYFKNRVTETAD
jgi:hypothetical protein